MRRREFVKFASGVAMAWPFAARAQQKTMPVIGALLSGQPSALISVSTRETFQRGLREEGYVDGQNISIEYRYAEDTTEFDRAANEIVGLGVDVIFTVSTPGAFAARRATSSIPIVAATMADPVADGLVASLSRPGGNVTGNTFLGPELAPKRLQLLQELVPGISRIAGLRHPGVYSERTMQNMLQTAAIASGIEFQVFNAVAPNDFLRIPGLLGAIFRLYEARRNGIRSRLKQNLMTRASQFAEAS